MPLRPASFLQHQHLRIKLQAQRSLLCYLSTAPTQPPQPLWLPTAIRAAAASGDRRSCRAAHALVLTFGAGHDRFLANNLITMYAKSGSLPCARLLFDQTPNRDSVTWNSLLSAHAQHGAASDAFSLFRRMLCSSPPVAPTHLSFTPLLKLCAASIELLPTSRAVHCCAFKIGLAANTMISSALVNVYSKFGFMEEGRRIFDAMDERDAVLWNIIIKGYAQMGCAERAFFMFSELHRSGVLAPDENAIRSILIGETGRGIKEQVRAYSIKRYVSDDSSDVISWNKKMTEHAKVGENSIVLNYFMEMKRSKVGHDNVTYVIVLSAVTTGGYTEVGKQIHGMAFKIGFCSDVSVSNNLINMYAKFGILIDAMQIFKEMRNLDLISWNTMIANCAQNSLELESIKLFVDALREGIIPDHFTLASVLRACSGIDGSFYVHEQVHSIALKLGLSLDSFVLTTLIDVCAKKGKLEEAQALFNSMDYFDLSSSNALIAGYVTNNDSLKTMDLFRSLLRDGEKPNDFTLTTILKGCSLLVALKEGRQIQGHAIKLGFDSDLCVSSGIMDMYIKCGQIDDASTVFSYITEPDDVAWTTMISGCVDNGDEDHAISLFHQMRQSGATPDEFIFASIIKACACLTTLEQGRQIHGNAIKLDCASDPFVVTSIMDMYAKCGNIEDSYDLFKRTDIKNVASWNAMILGLAQHGKGEEALDLFRNMLLKGVKPDKITFVGVISACSHSGLVSEAYRYFDLMLLEYCIGPEAEHYSCLVDALGRAGLLHDAERVIETMPFNASASMCRALLGACRIRGNMDVGGRIATRLLELEPLDSSAYVLLSNIYASANRWNDVHSARKIMQNKNVKKDPGSSWIEVKNKIHLFVVDDKSHPQSESIYQELEDLMRKIKDEGYIPDTDYVLLDVEKEEKERTLYYHSEKLAICYGLISIPSPQRIRVIKNLRVCGDCHNAIKYISKVVQREIVLRDASRFHCFGNGACSCGDYW